MLPEEHQEKINLIKRMSRHLLEKLRKGAKSDQLRRIDERLRRAEDSELNDCDEMPHHYIEHTDPERSNCVKQVGPCELENVGCNELVEIKKMTQHLETSIVKHLDLTRDKVLVIVKEYDALKAVLDVPRLSQNVGESADKIVVVERAVQKVERDLADVTTSQQNQQSARQANIDKQSRLTNEMKAKTIILDSKLSTYEGIVAVLNGQIERVANVVQATEKEQKQDRDLLASLERKIKSQDRIIALKDVYLAEQDLRIQSLEMASYDGVLVWKITDFNRKRNESISGRTTSIYSPCFFTSRHGYKMCARIYLNGDGMGKGNHISLFFVIMKGTFDGLLRWPFMQKVTFMILDQKNQDHVIDSFRPTTTSNSFQRPTGDMNIASGCPLFMPLSQLDSRRHAYVKDDCMFIKVIVDTTDLN
ncbi:TNF receptor-associated factor 2-like [Saccoglossus kowalevskii]